VAQALGKELVIELREPALRQKPRRQAKKQLARA
jgi:hypothetical protein